MRDGCRWRTKCDTAMGLADDSMSVLIREMAGRSPITASEEQKAGIETSAVPKDRREADQARAMPLTPRGWTRVTGSGGGAAGGQLRRSMSFSRRIAGKSNEASISQV